MAYPSAIAGRVVHDDSRGAVFTSIPSELTMTIT